MAGPLTPKRQYDHITETFIAFSTCNTLSLCRIYSLEQLTGSLIATVIVSFQDLSDENLKDKV